MNTWTPSASDFYNLSLIDCDQDHKLGLAKSEECSQTTWRATTVPFSIPHFRLTLRTVSLSNNAAEIEARLHSTLDIRVDKFTLEAFFAYLNNRIVVTWNPPSASQGVTRKRKWKFRAHSSRIRTQKREIFLIRRLFFKKKNYCKILAPNPRYIKKMLDVFWFTPPSSLA